MYACVHACMHMCLVRMHACVRMRVFMHACMHHCIHVYVCMNASMYTRMHEVLHTCEMPILNPPSTKPQMRTVELREQMRAHASAHACLPPHCAPTMRSLSSASRARAKGHADHEWPHARPHMFTAADAGRGARLKATAPAVCCKQQCSRSTAVSAWPLAVHKHTQNTCVLASSCPHRGQVKRKRSSRARWSHRGKCPPAGFVVKLHVR